MLVEIPRDMEIIIVPSTGLETGSRGRHLSMSQVGKTRQDVAVNDIAAAESPRNQTHERGE
jgi:hypothetical protein